MRWSSGVIERLLLGESVRVRPRGHSMKGRINDGDSVTIAPCDKTALKANDIVLVQIQGRRYSHLVLHQILKQREGRFLIGSQQGRIDGWVDSDAIYGIATSIESNQ